MLAFLAFSVDIGYLYWEKSRLQNSADAAAHACALEMHESSTQAKLSAVSYAELNSTNAGEILPESDVIFGTWDKDSRTFTPGGPSVNAVQVVCKRDSARGNAVPLFFASVLGIDSQNLTADAIAYAPVLSEGFRFLIDDEMIDSDEPSIEDLANQLGVDPDDLISDGDNDGFIDIPPGCFLELPTGQVGDEALFDATSYGGAFPFQGSSTFSTLDFLAEGTALQSSLGTQNMQGVEWSSSNAPHPGLEGSKVLDPVPGIDPVDSHADIAALADSETTHVSPVFKSDVSMAETDPSKYGSPAANLQGERRGLLAFKIVSSRSNPAGGSYLPLLTIEVIDPAYIDIESLTINQGGSGTAGGRISLVK